MNAELSLRWYAAQTHPHAEAKAKAHLQRQGFDSYLPRYLKQRRHARRVEVVARPLFPRYLFVAIDTQIQRWHAIRSTIGISRLVGTGDGPAPVPQDIIDALKRRENADGFVVLAPPPRFAPGDKVRVVEGVFSDSLGLYQGMTGKERVAILLDLLGRKVRVALDPANIDAA